MAAGIGGRDRVSVVGPVARHPALSPVARPRRPPPGPVACRPAPSPGPAARRLTPARRPDSEPARIKLSPNENLTRHK
jgi:hypothetical protein